MPLYKGHTAIFTCADRLNKYCRLIPCFSGKGALSACLVAKLFFDNEVRFFGIPAKVISDRDPRYTVFFFYRSCAPCWG